MLYTLTCYHCHTWLTSCPRNISFTISALLHSLPALLPYLTDKLPPGISRLRYRHYYIPCLPSYHTWLTSCPRNISFTISALLHSLPALLPYLTDKLPPEYLIHDIGIATFPACPLTIPDWQVAPGISHSRYRHCYIPCLPSYHTWLTSCPRNISFTISALLHSLSLPSYHTWLTSCPRNISFTISALLHSLPLPSYHTWQVAPGIFHSRYRHYYIHSLCPLTIPDWQVAPGISHSRYQHCYIRCLCPLTIPDWQVAPGISRLRYRHYYIRCLCPLTIPDWQVAPGISRLRYQHCYIRCLCPPIPTALCPAAHWEKRKYCHSNKNHITFSVYKTQIFIS